MNWMGILVASSLYVGAAFAGNTAKEMPAAAQPADVAVRVEGMTCSSCMNKVKKELAKLTEGKYKDKGVKFEVVLTEVKAQVGTLDGGKLSATEVVQLKKDIAAAVTKAGYKPIEG